MEIYYTQQIDRNLGLAIVMTIFSVPIACLIKKLLNNISRCCDVFPLSSVVCQSNSKSVNALLDIYTVRLENGGFPSTLYTV